MKNLLLTCFLALPCLFGSTTVLRKVAQSPPEPPLHRSAVPVSPHSGDTHRGGPSRPDTFTALDGSAETWGKAIYTTNVSAIDGGPALRSPVSRPPTSSNETASLRAFARSDDPLHWESVLSTVKASDIRHRTSDIKLNFGLVDPDQDNEEGKEASNFHSSSVPVYTEPVHSSRETGLQNSEAQSLASCVLCLATKKSPSFPVFSNQINSGREAYSLSTEAQSLVSNVLCLAANNPAPVTVFLVHRIPESAGNLVVDLWDAEMYGLENFDNHQRMEIAPMAPHILTGLMPREERGYKFRTPSISTSSILRLSLAHYPVIRDFRVSPGDSVMILVNEKTASLIFTGPSAPKFRLQKELNEVVNSFTQGLDVGLSFSSELELQAYLDRPGNRAAWDSISTSFGRKTMLKVAGKPELKYLRGISLKESISDLQKRLDLYRDKVSETDLQAIYAESIGSLYQIYLRKLSSGYESAVKLGDSQLIQQFGDFIQARISFLPEGLSDADAKESPAFRDYLAALAVLKAKVSESDFFDTVFGMFSPEVAERITVQYLSDVRKRLPNFEDQAVALDTRLKSPEMKSVLAEMLGRFGQGAPLFSFDLPTLDGNRIIPQDFEGKAMLIDFWITGCGACKSFHERIFDPLIEKYSEHPDLQIISVCADRKPDYWIQQGGTPDVSHEGFIPAYAERSSDSNPLLSHYNIHSYPQMMLVRPDGTLFRLGRVPLTLAEAEQLLQEVLNPADPVNTNSSTTQNIDK